MTGVRDEWGHRGGEGSDHVGLCFRTWNAIGSTLAFTLCGMGATGRSWAKE